MAKLARVRSLLAKLESTYGSDPTPTGSDDAVQISNLEITPLEADVVSRDLIRNYLGANQQLLANKRVVLTFSVEYAGSGTAGTAPKYDPILRACGMLITPDAGTSTTYTPRSSGFESCTIYYDTDGLRHIVTGCRGSFTVSLNSNAIPVFNFTLTGQYNVPTDTASPTLTFSNQAVPEIFNDTNAAGFTFFGESGLALQSAEIDLGNEVIYRELVNSDKEVHITNRNTTGNFVIEAPSLSTHDFFADAVAGTTGSLSIIHGDTAGNIITLTTPTNGLSLGNPTYSEDQGIVMLNLPTNMVPSSSGNDDITIAFT